MGNSSNYDSLKYGSCTSGRGFASSFLQIPPRGGHPCSRLTVGVSPTPVRDLHPKDSAHVGRTITANMPNSAYLLNFRMDAQSPMALILVGQSELWEKLRLQAYTIIRQRIDLQCKIPYYDRSQVQVYIERHLTYAGATQDLFTDKAIDEIHRFSSGAARLVNKVCTHSLMYGAQTGHRLIDDHDVTRVIQGELV